MRIVVATILLLAIAAPAEAAQDYVVRSGDTLWEIAARYKVSVRAIVEASGLSSPDDLQIGQKLIIPTEGARRSSPKASATYVVRQGDSLWTIARRTGSRVETLADLNGIDPDATLRVGQVLKLTGPAATTPSTAPIGPSATVKRTAKILPYRGTSWASSLIGLSRRFIGTPYRWGATGPRAFDCSGFMLYVYGRTGISLPRTSHAMYQAGRAVPPDQLQPGDMVFFTTYRPGPSHNGIYIGNGQFIHASSGYGSVTITPMSKEYYKERYLGARRF